MENDTIKIRILVLDRGFVLVCRCPDPLTQNPFWLEITDSRTIRDWGTTEGLGQLVDGPLPDTVLDAMIPSETIPVRAIIRVINVSQTGWKRFIK